MMDKGNSGPTSGTIHILSCTIFHSMPFFVLELPQMRKYNSMAMEARQSEHIHFCIYNQPIITGFLSRHDYLSVLKRQFKKVIALDYKITPFHNPHRDLCIERGGGINSISFHSHSHEVQGMQLRINTTKAVLVSSSVEEESLASEWYGCQFYVVKNLGNH